MCKRKSYLKLLFEFKVPSLFKVIVIKENTGE